MLHNGGLLLLLAVQERMIPISQGEGAWKELRRARDELLRNEGLYNGFSTDIGTGDYVHIWRGVETGVTLNIHDRYIIGRPAPGIRMPWQPQQAAFQNAHLLQVVGSGEHAEHLGTRLSGFFEEQGYQIGRRVEFLGNIVADIIRKKE